MTETHIPNSCTLYVTSKCNLKCKFCRRQLAEMKKSKDMTLDIVKKIDIKFPTIQGYCICGFGETLINKNVFDIISFLKSKNKFVGLITNGILVDKYIEQIKNSNVDYISVSLNASSKEEYIDNTSSDCFNATLNNIKLLLKNNINTYVTYIVGKHNIKNVNKFVKLMDKIGVKTVYLHNILPHSDEYDEFFEANVLTIKDKELLDKYITKSNIIKLYPTLVDYDNEYNYCKFSYYHVAVDGDGDLGICNSILPTAPEFGNLDDKDAFNNDYCANFRMNVLLKMPLCKKCFRSMNEEARYK